VRKQQNAVLNSIEGA